ncbi:MAG: hypothetical protein QG597_2875 [Actinomycetota bacterium]|nr:hypothetical protein [Actinomycetota bacterium]
MPVTSRDVTAAGVTQHVECVGVKPAEGAPTVVLMAGLGGAAQDAWDGVFPSPAATLPARTCLIDRPGVGLSPARSTDVNSPVLNASETLAALAAADEPGPYVFAGWSYGGLVALLAADEAASADPPELAGLVLIDPTLPDEYRTLDTVGWTEGGVDLDMTAGEAAAADIDLGDAPVVIVIAGQNKTNVDHWSEVVGKQSDTARTSRDFLVVHHPQVGHDVTGEDPTTVISALSAAVAAAPSTTELAGCDTPPAGLGAPLECLLSD